MTLRASEDTLYANRVGLNVKAIRLLGGAEYLKSIDSDARAVLLNQARGTAKPKRIGSRPTLRRGEPTPAEKKAARVHARTRAGGICEIRSSPQCTLDKILPLDGGLMVRGHLAHFRAKRRYGWHESAVTGQKHLWACSWCHLYEHAGKKPAPRKAA